MQVQTTFTILSSMTLVIFSSFFHKIHQYGIDFNLICSGPMVTFLAVRHGKNFTSHEEYLRGHVTEGRGGLSQYLTKERGLGYKVVVGLINKSRNKIQQTWGQSFSQALYICNSMSSSVILFKNVKIPFLQ